MLRGKKVGSSSGEETIIVAFEATQETHITLFNSDRIIMRLKPTAQQVKAIRESRGISLLEAEKIAYNRNKKKKLLYIKKQMEDTYVDLPTHLKPLINIANYFISVQLEELKE